MGVIGLNRDEIIEVLNTLNTLYPMAFNNLSSEKRRNIYISQYTKHLGDIPFNDVMTAIDNWVANDESGKAPTISVLKARANKERDRRLSKEGRGSRRIETVDEYYYNLYLVEMKKEPSKRNEWLIQQLLPACEIMTNPEAYKAKYGKYREEFERL